jgi:hypothetical protein
MLLMQNCPAEQQELSLQMVRLSNFPSSGFQQLRQPYLPKKK